MKLELKHITPYLPFKLKCYEPRFNEKHTILGLIKNEIYIGDEDSINSFVLDDETFPILRPLSDLTKEIEVNGKKFIPAEILFSVENDELQDFKDFGKIPEYWKDAIKIKPKWYDYYQVEFLFEWHFDVFGLIENKLAIDINTLQKP